MNPPLWAPWRIQYIVGPKNNGGCVFCDYASRPEPNVDDLTLGGNSLAYIVFNRYPFAAGHLMVIPKRHVASLLDLTPEEYAATFALVRASVDRLQKAVRCEGLNIGINMGSAAGAGIAEHLHVHLVPRWSGDTNFMPVLADTRVIPQALEATWAHLKPFFVDLPDS